MGIRKKKKRQLCEEDEMSLVAKLRQRSVYGRITHIDWGRGSIAPFVVEFDPTTACNLACPDCISRDLLNQGFFSRKRIRLLTQEMVEAGVKAVVLIGGGEPLMHPEIGWIIEYLGKNDVHIGITTNGIQINKYIEPIAQYAKWIRVSVDAATPETFHRIRPSRTDKNMFSKVIANMEMLAKMKTGKLGFSFMIYTEGEFEKSPSSFRPDGAASASDRMEEVFTNAFEIYRGARLARDIGCDYFEVKPMYNIRHFAIHQNRTLITVIQREMEKASTLAGPDFRILQATKLKNTLEGDGGIEEKPYGRCAVSELRTLVTPTGVYVCPYFRGRKDRKIGDVRRESFSDMWNGERRRKVMTALDPSRHCKMHCIRNDSNFYLEDMIAGRHIEIIDDFDRFL